MGTPPLPAGFTPLEKIDRSMREKPVNLIGIVVDFLPPRLSKGYDHSMRIEICDKTKSLKNTALKVQLFRPVNLLPNVSKLPGDVLVFFNVKVTVWKDVVTVVGGTDPRLGVLAKWIHFSVPDSSQTTAGPKISYTPPDIRSTTPPAKMSAILEYANHLSGWWDLRGGYASASGLAPTHAAAALAKTWHRPLALIKDVEFGKFCDIVGQVVKTWNMSGTTFTIWITDYTKNENVKNYEWGRAVAESEMWPGPWGQYTLQITLWDYNATWAAQNVAKGMYIHLENVRGKKSREYTLEGVVNSDRDNPQRQRINYIKNEAAHPQVIAIKQREAEYNRRFKDQSTGYAEVMQRKIEEEERMAQEQRDEENRKVREMIEARGNQHVRCTKTNHPVTQLGDIIIKAEEGEDFQNMNYRIFCKVVNFLPENMLDFAKPLEAAPDDRDSADEADKSNEDDPVMLNEDGSEMLNEDGSKMNGQKWYWRFALLVEGKDGVQMRVVVEGNDAMYLLRIKPVDLRKNPGTFALLQERLFLLWGNLAEVKSGGLDRPPQGPRKRKNHASGGGDGNNKKRRPSGGSASRQDCYSDTGSDSNRSYRDDSLKTLFFNACIKGWGQDMPDGAVRQMWNLTGTTIL